MAESNLSIDVNSIKRHIGLRHGWGRDHTSWSAQQNTDFEYVSKRALREFYYPPISGDTPYYEWTFLRKAGTITLATNDVDYDLPDDFGGTILDQSVTYAAGNDYPNPTKISEARLRRLQARENSTGWPRYYAVRNKTHAPTTGQRWEMLVYPKPTATQNGQTLLYRYVYLPDNIDTTNKYPAGGGQYSEIVLAAFLAAAELELDGDPAGPYRQQFVNLLATAIRNDEQQKTDDGGVA